MRPAFAGKYFIGSPWRWVHGEGTALVDPAVPGASLAVVPIQASDPVRQAEAGDLGQQWGTEDGNALADAIQGALQVGDLALGQESGTPVYVYLEIEEDTALSPDYWAAWASSVSTAMVVGEKTVGEFAIPLLQRLLPCVATTFAATADGHWQAPQPITTALDGSSQVGWTSARCYGFWATTPDPTTIEPAPTLNWSSFAPYSQKQRSGPDVPVPVNIWRYATGNPAAPVNQVGTVTLEATAAASGQPDPVLNAMLNAQSWTASEDPVAIGVDRGGSLSKWIGCLSAQNLTVTNLPEPTAQGGVAGRALSPALSVPVSFAGRYYSAGPTNGNAPPRRCKDLSQAEAGILSRAGVDIVSAFQARVDYDDIPGYLATAANGTADAMAAGWFAATQAHQPAHTPIYFAVDCDVTPDGTNTNPSDSGAIDDEQLKDYFTAVADGLARYLANQENKTRVPYAVGIYGCAHAFDVLYPLGLASHFWQARPGTWGDVAGTPPGSNATPWMRANLWQVSLADLQTLQASSGLLACGSTWILQVNNQPGPAQIQVTMGTSVTPVTYPPTVAKLGAATGADVCITTPQTGLTWYLMDFSAAPAGLAITSVGGNPAGFEMALEEQPGIADLDVSWGDPGGWRAARDGA